MKQTTFQKTNWSHRLSHGGSLRNQRAGRGARPLSSKEPIHLVFKANQEVIRGGLRSARRFGMIQHLMRKYSKKFFIKIEQVSIQNDHIHVLVRISRRSLFQGFLRVVGGQIAQQFQKQELMTVRAAKPVTGTPDVQSRGQRSHPIGSNVTGTPQARSRGQQSHTINPNVTGTPSARRKDARTTTKSPAKDESAKLWKHRPFTRVVRGWKAYRVVRDYITLNEKEARGEIPYSKLRLRGLRPEQWERFWV